MSFIDDLTIAQIENDPLPIRELLVDSYYYPASEFDGQLVKFAPNHIQSFVYCDYAQGEQALMGRYRGFYGYTPIAIRSLRKEELIPNGWPMQIPPSVSRERYFRYLGELPPPFAKWIVYQRNADKGELHGPSRFSLLYIGGEGVATYQALYWANNTAPAGLAIIQPGTGWGFNWTDFTRADGALAWVVLNNQNGTLQTIYFGGNGGGYQNLYWPGYASTGAIEPYYTDGTGRVTIWEREGVAI